MKRAGMVARVILLMLPVFLFFAIHWFFTTWERMTVNEFIFHLKVSLGGTSSAIIRKFVKHCILPTTLTGAAGVILFFLAKGKKKRVLTGVLATMAIVLLIVDVVYVWKGMDISGYIASQKNASTFIEERYADPKEVSITFPEKKRNLIYIYLESMEVTFSDTAHGGAFENNLIPELTELSEEGEDFSGDSPLLNGGVSLPGTDWTIAGMFAQTAGLPLQTPVGQDAMSTQNTFFPGIVTLGDILAEEGYSQVLMLGSDATFGGRNLYFESHGQYHMEDYPYALENHQIPDGYKVWWGYEDEKLFGFAKKRLQELAREPEPFNLTLLTVDTHFENGYTCADCPNNYPNDPYADVFSCSSKKTADFVRWIQQQEFYEDTTIVIAGDHPTMDADFCRNVPGEYERKVFTLVVNGAAQPKDETRVRSYTTFDLFPTTLAALGVQIEGDRLGLGVNLYAEEDSLPEELGMEVAISETANRSVFLERISELDPYNDAMAQRAMETDVSHMDPTADVEIRFHDDYKTVDILVTAIHNLQERVQSVEATFTKNGDYEHRKKQELKQGEDGSYRTTLDLSELDPEDIEIQVYANGSLGEQYPIYSLMGSMLLKQKDFNEYLDALYDRYQNGRTYEILIAVGEAETGKLTEEDIASMQRFGIMKDMETGQNFGYCAYIADGNAREVYGKEPVELNGKLKDGREYHLSSDWTIEDGAGVFIDGEPMLVPERGIHFYVIDDNTGLAADYVRFDLGERVGKRGRE